MSRLFYHEIVDGHGRTGVLGAQHPSTQHFARGLLAHAPRGGAADDGDGDGDGDGGGDDADDDDDDDDDEDDGDPRLTTSQR
jgi:hypothetical protein